jgi:RND family efflux transporter MFP subunit
MFVRRSVFAVAVVLALELSAAGLVPSGGRVVQPAGEPAARDLAEGFEGVKSIARPSRDSTMGFSFPAEIAEVVVRGGQTVRKGDALIRANDAEARAQRDLQRIIAESELDVQRAQVAVDQAKVEFDAQTDLKTGGGGSKVDYDRARTLLDARRVELDIARLNREQQVIQLRFREAQLERFTLRAPFDGRVDVVQTDVGEVKKDSEPVVRVVNTDPLWIDAFVPTFDTLTLGLSPGAKAWVLMDLPGAARVHVGTVVELAPVADSASDSRRVRVELPNPGDWPGGVTAWVRFTEPTGVWAPRIVVNGVPLNGGAPR